MPATCRTVAIAAVCCLMLVTAACGTEVPPPSSSSPSASSPSALTLSDDEAFAQAEETYRAYVDALNSVDISDPATFEPVFALTTGELNQSDRVGLTRYNAEKVKVEGASQIASAKLRSRDAQQIVLDVCLDVSRVSVTNSQGASLVAPDRADMQRLVVSLEPSDPATDSWKVAQVGGRADGPEC